MSCSDRHIVVTGHECALGVPDRLIPSLDGPVEDVQLCVAARSRRERGRSPGGEAAVIEVDVVPHGKWGVGALGAKQVASLAGDRIGNRLVLDVGVHGRLHDGRQGAAAVVVVVRDGPAGELGVDPKLALALQNINLWSGVDLWLCLRRRSSIQ